MYFLVSDTGRWATKNNEMIFKYVVFLGETPKDALKYHLIDDEGNDLKVNVADYIQKDIWGHYDYLEEESHEEHSLEDSIFEQHIIKDK